MLNARETSVRRDLELVHDSQVSTRPNMSEILSVNTSLDELGRRGTNKLEKMELRLRMM
jgi:hypothetical protein